MNTLEILQDLLIKEYKLTREQLTPDAQLASLGVDSLGLIELMFLIEDRFAITLTDDKSLILVTIGDLVAYVDHLVVVPAGTPQPNGAATAMPVT